ncbi:MAG: zinc ribbon domain-containing protein [Armatimonadota bacterium]
MKCPKCGAYNGKTNKFCRECGLHLAWVVEDDNLLAGKASDEVALGEALAEVYDCYESGDMDVALAGAEKIVFNNPGSTSAHGVLALIYERKGELELDAYNAQAARDYLELALAEYEKIVSLNPDSTADREKLVVLRAKLKGKKSRVPVVGRQIARLKAVVMSAPPQALAAGITFIVVLMLAIILIPGPKKSLSPRRSKLSSGSMPQASVVPSNSVNTGASQGLKVYTFPAPAAATQAPTTPAPTPAPSNTLGAKPHISEVKPVKLPPIGNELTIVAEPKKSGKASAKVEPVQPKIVKSAASAQKTDTTPKANGTSLLAAAIQLRNQGRTQDAISTAEQAITHFQSEINSGSNATSAQRGIENARKLISLWQQAQ